MVRIKYSNVTCQMFKYFMVSFVNMLTLNSLLYGVILHGIFHPDSSKKVVHVISKKFWPHVELVER